MPLAQRPQSTYNLVWHLSFEVNVGRSSFITWFYCLYHTETSITAEGRTLYTVPQLSSTGAQGEKTRCSEPLRQPRSQNTALLSFQVRVHLSSDLQESFNKVWPNASIGKRNSFYFYPSTFDSLYPLSPSSHMKNWKKKSGKITNLARINWNPHALWEAKWFSYYRKEYGSS